MIAIAMAAQTALVQGILAAHELLLGGLVLLMPSVFAVAPASIRPLSVPVLTIAVIAAGG